MSTEKNSIKIQINKNHYDTSSETMTGAQLKTLGGIPAGNKLFKEEHGKDPDRLINDGDSVPVHNGDKFYDLPPGVVG